MRVVFVENHDSFSWNVIDLLPFERSEVTVCTANDARPLLEGADALVIGPGPMDPIRAGLLELVHVAASERLPTLGICLGHQALGQAFGAQVTRSQPTHGHTSTATFASSRLLPGIDGAIHVMRYHSLSLAGVPAPLRVIASLDDGAVMGVEHTTLPMLGLQFHPDSYATPRGRELVEAFFRSTLGREPAPRRQVVARPLNPSARIDTPPTQASLSSLEAQTNFALLGPGYSTHGGWTLMQELVPSAGRRGERSELGLCTAEDRAPTWFSGSWTPVDLALDAPPATLAPQLDESGFDAGVAAIHDAIAAGDVYQVNLTLRAHLAPVDGASLLATLCARGVPRFAAWVKTPELEFVSASPELLFEVDHGALRAEPMKGTAPAGERAWLEASEKDQAELAMITDLLRNDLAQLCLPGSVQVPNARRFIELPYVVQAVSDVTGTLRDDVTLDDVLRGLHPGGSVTGAPREAAVRLITQLEATPRGPYCGALLLRTGVELARCALLIRTATRTPTGWTWGVGSGITWGSQAQAELDEVRLKLGALRTT